MFVLSYFFVIFNFIFHLWYVYPDCIFNVSYHWYFTFIKSMKIFWFFQRTTIILSTIIFWKWLYKFWQNMLFNFYILAIVLAILFLKWYLNWFTFYFYFICSELPLLRNQREKWLLFHVLTKEKWEITGKSGESTGRSQNISLIVPLFTFAGHYRGIRML